MKLNTAKFHPTTWWLVGIAISISSALSRNSIFLISICVMSISLMALLKPKNLSSGPTLSFYLIICGLIVLSRILFRIMFNTSTGGETILFSLPNYELNLGFGTPIKILGSVSVSDVSGAFFDGIRLAAIVLGIGLAASLSSPRKLLKSTPPVLFELATSVAMATNLAPQLLKSIGRVKAARHLRGRSSQLGLIPGLAIPVLEDAIESSLRLAASMNARGFGQNPKAGIRIITGMLSVFSASCLAIGSYLMAAIDFKNIIWVVIGLVLLSVSVILANSQEHRTRLKINRYRIIDLPLILGAAVLTLIASLGWVS